MMICNNIQGLCLACSDYNADCRVPEVVLVLTNNHCYYQLANVGWISCSRQDTLISLTIHSTRQYYNIITIILHRDRLLHNDHFIPIMKI